MCVGTCGRRFGRAFSIKSSHASYKEVFLQANATCEFARTERSTLNVQHTFWHIFSCFIVGLTLSNLKSECNAIVALISKIVVSSSDRCDFDFVTNIDCGRESLKGLSRILPTLSRVHISLCRHENKFSIAY